mgnify:CR=1 FL=1
MNCTTKSELERAALRIFSRFLCSLQALYLAEQKAREAVETRARIQHELLSNQKERKEDELRKLAQQARMDRVGGTAAVVPHDQDQGKNLCRVTFFGTRVFSARSVDTSSSPR